MKTSTLTGAELSRAVNLALGAVWTPQRPGQIGYWTYLRAGQETFSAEAPNYATDIALAWPIIKERHIGIYPPAGARRGWEAFCQPDSNKHELVAHEAEDPLVAAMRVVVLIAFGDTVELP